MATNSTSGRRPKRLGELIKMTLGQTLLEMSDPRLKMVTLTRIELAKDFKRAKVFFSVLGNEDQQRTALRGLNHARGRLQAEIHHRLSLRYTPILSFVYDPAIERSLRISQLLNEALPDSPEEIDTQDE